MPRSTVFFSMIAAATLLGGCSSYRDAETNQTTANERSVQTTDAIARFKEKDPSIQKFFDSAHGYVVFSEITKGAIGVGAAHGEGGIVYENGRRIGTAEVTQVTVGAQLGGQSYAEIVFFQNAAAMETFKQNNLEFSANASAVAASAGAAATADYADGVAVFTMPNGGLMFEASIGGQKFKYYP